MPRLGALRRLPSDFQSLDGLVKIWKSLVGFLTTASLGPEVRLALG
jgi:hypothetical protein